MLPFLCKNQDTHREQKSPVPHNMYYVVQDIVSAQEAGLQSKAGKRSAGQMICLRKKDE